MNVPPEIDQAGIDRPAKTAGDAGPRIAITLGEESSVGPEVMSAAIQEALSVGCHVTVVVGRGLATWARALLTDGSATRVDVVEADSGPDAELQAIGRSTRVSRQRAFAALAALVDLAESGAVDAIVTGPVPKGIFDHFENERPPGQTEYVAGRMDVASFAMMLAGPKLRVVPVTTHIAIADVADALSADAIVQTAMAAERDLRQHFAIPVPRVAVCGLNPHAGEGGRIGDEEARFIGPAVDTLRGMGVDATGPVSADAVFGDALAGAWDVVICMYHDQGLGPLKTVHARDAINFTCGLPVPRMSPDHGTAYDIAGRGEADTTSARHAVRRAAMIAATSAAQRQTAKRTEQTHAA